MTSIAIDTPAEAIQLIRRAGDPVRMIARSLGVHRSTVYRWARGQRRPASRVHLTRLILWARRAAETLARQEMERRAAVIEPTWRWTRQGERVVYGPTVTVRTGATVTVAGETVTVARVGRPFVKDGVEMVYGYLSSQPSRRRVGSGRCACGCGQWLTDLDYRASAVPGYAFDCA